MKIEMRLNWITIPLITVCVMLISRYLMMGNWQWYHTLKLPPITPSGTFIQGIWQLIYVLTTGCVLVLYNNIPEHTRRFVGAITLFVVSTTLNVYWIYLFFNQHLMGWATLCAAALSVSLGLLIWVVWPVSLFCALLLVPYVSWITFATLLNAWIWLIN
jgi:benzodiazapine receptor